MYVCSYIQLFMYIYLCVCMCVCACITKYTCIHVYILVQTFQ